MILLCVNAHIHIRLVFTVNIDIGLINDFLLIRWFIIILFCSFLQGIGKEKRIDPLLLTSPINSSITSYKRTKNNEYWEFVPVLFYFVPIIIYLPLVLWLQYLLLFHRGLLTQVPYDLKQKYIYLMYSTIKVSYLTSHNHLITLSSPKSTSSSGRFFSRNFPYPQRKNLLRPSWKKFKISKQLVSGAVSGNGLNWKWLTGCSSSGSYVISFLTSNIPIKFDSSSTCRIGIRE